MAKIVGIKRTLWDQLYIPAMFKGVYITLKHFFINVFAPKKYKQITTVNYPFETKEEYQARLPERYRGKHRLMKRDDGSVRCTACMMCATICPAHCIHIEAGERVNPSSRDVEKYPVKFEINELICVVCGLCVEACPCDALRMDTHEHMEPVLHRSMAVLDKDNLMSRGNRSIALDGGLGANWREKHARLGALTAIYEPDHLKGETKS